MTAAIVEECLATPEMRLDSFQRLLDDRAPPQQAAKTEKRGWQALVGTFADDSLYEEAMCLGREWRDSQREDANEPAPVNNWIKRKYDETTRAH